MLGALMELPDFQAETLQEVQAGIAADMPAWARQGLDNTAAEMQWQVAAAGVGLERVDEFAIYGGDPVVRRSAPLQRTADAKAARTARMSADTAASLQVAAGDTVRARAGTGEAQLTVAIDAALPQGVVRIARGIPETAALGEGALSLEKIAAVAAA
jgi:NADH-quinone oxidoreductase subunit G